MAAVLDEIRMGDIGTEFRLQILDEDDVPLDLTVGTPTLKIYFTKPTGAIVVKDGIAGSTQNPALLGSAGWVHYISISGDIDVSGDWVYEAWVDVFDREFTSEHAMFKVVEPYWKRGGP